MNGRYRDLIALVEFGDEAYVVTPFTSDYDNILLSLSLVGDWTEFMRFPDQGTTIGMADRAERRAVPHVRFPERLRQRDDHLQRRPGSPGDRARAGPSTDILAEATRAKIPVYLIRIELQQGARPTCFPIEIWKPAVEATGGRFYAAADESTILRAINEIDRRSAGTIATQALQHRAAAVLAVRPDRRDAAGRSHSR